MSDLPSHSRAAVFQAPRQPMTLQDFPIEAPTGHQAIVRITCATICGSDLHTFFGRRQSPAPSVLGHEMVGQIAAIGSLGVSTFEGAPLHIGDRVTWSMVWSCGQCFFCQSGLRPKCERLMKFGHHGMRGGFAEYCLLPEGTAIFRVPSTVPDIVASPANCATATVAAVLRTAGSVTGANVVILGAGMLGLTACAMATASGASHVVAIDTDPFRTAHARDFGATASLDALNRGADFVLDFAGTPEAIESGWQLLRPGGAFLLAGSVFPARPVSLPAEQIVRRLLRIQGVYNYQPADLAAALRFLGEHGARFPFASLVPRTFPLDEIQLAFQFAEHARPPRVAVRPQCSSR